MVDNLEDWAAVHSEWPQQTGGTDQLEDHKYNKDKYLVLHLEWQVHQYSLRT